MKKISFLVFILMTAICQAQDQLEFAIDTVDTVDVEDFVVGKNEIINPNGLIYFFQKLSDQNSKINVAHVGDSHLQADIFSGIVRQNLQNQFGNAGRGFVFPHKLVQTNGANDVKFSSNITWEHSRNIGAVDNPNVGLSGYVIQSKNKKAHVKFELKNSKDYYTTLKVVTPQNINTFNFATTSKISTTEKVVPAKPKNHKIKKGEAISIIADKYDVSIESIKKLNRLKNNNIQAGKTLKIPSSKNQTQVVNTFSFDPISLKHESNVLSFTSDTLRDSGFIIANKDFDRFELNGIILENNNPGILYHAIGVNGSRFSDYSKYSMFFSQLQAIQPQLMIVSFGTNESYDKLSAADFMNQLETYISQVRNQFEDISILVTTPPPSMYKRVAENHFVELYANAIIENSEILNYAVWDMYHQLGGNKKINSSLKGLIASDKVHYTKAGYELQGNLLSSAIIEAFQQYLSAK